MRNLLMIVLLTTVSGIKCTLMAQEINDDDKQKIIDYVNCYYTAKYVLNTVHINESEKEVIKVNGIDTVSIGYACKYDSLNSILISGNLTSTANNLTKKLNERNSNIQNECVLEFVDNVVDVDTEDFNKFEFTRKDECTVRNAVVRWYINKTICQKKDEAKGGDEFQSRKEDEKPSDWNWGWIPLAIIILYVLAKIILTIKCDSNNDTEETQSHEYSNSQSFNNLILRNENDKLKEENRKLKEELERQKNKLKEEIKEQNEDEVKNEIETSFQKNIEKNTKSTTTVIYYADVDVSNNQFVRTYEKCIKKSIYVIDANQHTFTLISDEQLYEDNLSRANSSGILGACEVNGSYKRGKAVSIIPGTVQQEENGKWRILNKAIIEIK